MAEPYSDVAAFKQRKSLHIDKYGTFSPHTGFTDFKHYKARYYRTATSGPNAGKLVDIRDPKNPVVVTDAHSATIEKDIKAYKSDKVRVHGLSATLRRNIGSKLKLPFMTESPIADEKYSSQLSYVNRLKKGNVLDPVRRFFSKPGTDGSVFDYQRSLAIQKAEQRLLDLEPGTTKFRQKGRRLVDSAPEVSQGYWGGADGTTWITTSGSSNNGGVDNTVTASTQDGSTNGSAQLTGDTESNVGNSEVRQNSNQTVSNNAVDNNVNQLRTWRRGTGENIAGANARTEKWLTDRGVDISQISKYDKSAVYRDLRISGPQIVNGNIILSTRGTGANSRFSLKINRDL